MQKLIVPASIYNANERNNNEAIKATASLLTLEQLENSVPSSEQYNAKK